MAREGQVLPKGGIMKKFGFVLVLCGLVSLQVAAQETSFKNTDLVGTWQSKGCETFVFNNQNSFMLRHFDFTASTWQLKFTLYADPSCAVPLLTTRLAGAFVLGDSVKQLANTRNVTWGQSAKFVTPHAPAILNAMNQSNCGDGSLAFDAERDVSLIGCLAFGVPNVKDYPQEFDLLKLENKQLFTGLRTQNMNLESNRPTQMFEFPLLKR
jgi:hypothetical protein